MNEVEAVAIFAGLLIVFSRLPAVFWPAAVKKFAVAFWKKTHKLLAAVFLVLAMVVFFLVFSGRELADVVAPIFGYAMLVGAWMLWDPDFGKAVSQVIYKKSDAWIRSKAIVSVAIGLLVVYLVLQAVWGRPSI